METQKVLNLLNGSDNENLKFATKKNGMLFNKRCLFTQKSNQIFNKFIRSSLCDYSGAYVFFTGNIAVVGGDDNTSFIYKLCTISKMQNINKR